ncbi:twin-arginine translocase subunit TatC [Allosalinactinospora lopnorensis]|uniref:twin-arginine translocase subunit TatC n=1 Tax=Allosalinactinospora lopnorensis TaxID=1352348 RepID=UPI000623EE3A|nr:twin-arginine translocase subunit TatC [Allosalinactinospora lopnorensis]
MPLMEHLRELRNRVLKSLVFVTVGVGLGFVFFDPVWEFLKQPYCALPQSNEVVGGDTEACSLIYTGIFEAFFLKFKVAVIVGIVAACPFWLYQLWAFVAPALRGKEKRYTYAFVATAVPLFLTGAALAYFITQKTLEILFGFASEGEIAMITITNYLNYMITMILVFGIAFVVPLIVVLLNLIGVLPHAAIAKWRRLIIFLACVLAAVVTPAEPFSMVALAIPVVLLFEMAELFCYVNDRRKGKADPMAGLDDDEASPLEETPGAAPNR